MAQHSHRDGIPIAFSVCVNMALSLRVSDIPPEVMAIISDCQVPLVLVGVTWPYDLAKSPLLYANAAMLDLLGDQSRNPTIRRASARFPVQDRRSEILLPG